MFGSNLKLIRNDFIRDLDNNLVNYSFDNSTTESRYGTNDWSKSYIRKFLNDFYIIIIMVMMIDLLCMMVKVLISLEENQLKRMKL